MSRSVARILVCTLAAGALAGITPARPAAQQHADVRGRVDIGIPLAMRRQAAAYPSRSVSQSSLAPSSELRNVVVYLKDAPARQVPPVRVQILQQNETFLPRVVAVPVGSTVAFPNEDHIYHNVFSLSRAGTFNLGRYPHGRSGEVRFDKPGVVKVFCDIHSHMTATVLVFNHPWFGSPDDGGRFELGGLPPGDRDITAWHERLGDTTLRVRLEPGRAASADFTLPVPAQ